MPTGHTDLWLVRMFTFRNSEFLYKTSFDKLYELDLKNLANKLKTRRRMARERRGAGSSVFGIETLYYKPIY